MKMKLFMLMGSLGVLVGCATTDYTSADYVSASSCFSCSNPCNTSCQESVRTESYVQTEEAFRPSCGPHAESFVVHERYSWDRGMPEPVAANEASCNAPPSFVRDAPCFKGESYRRAYK